MKRQRSILPTGAELTLSRIPQRSARSASEHFTILSTKGAGSSAVCYEAELDTVLGKRHVLLKEYNPSDTPLRRNKSNQLLMGSSPNDGGKNQYLKPYQQLFEVQRSRDGQTLKNYFQTGSVLYGTSARKDSPATVYICSEGRHGESISDFLSRIHKNPNNQPEQHLRQLIALLSTMSDALHALHENQILHLDLKPDCGLLEYDSHNTIKPDSISLFDINSLYPLANGLDDLAQQPPTLGTDGYSAPELRHWDYYTAAFSGLRPSTDLYSLGAILFYSLVPSPDGTAGLLYCDEFYKHLPQFVESAPLLHACVFSTAQKRAEVTRCLTHILQKCLHPLSRKRFSSAEQLRRALEALRQTLEEERYRTPTLPSEMVQTRCMQQLLSRHPLFEAFPHTKELHLLAVGNTALCEAFLDQSLQACQVDGLTVQITVLTPHAQTAQKNYIANRPSLPRFVRIEADGICTQTSEEVYGVIRFLTLPTLSPSALTAWAEQTETAFHYAFVDLPNHNQNREAAEVLRPLIAPTDAKAMPPVFYAHFGDRMPTAHLGIASPVWVNSPASLGEGAPSQLEQMAFAAHLCWSPAKNQNLSRAFRLLRADPYNFNSSIAFALSLPYKLHGLGIECDMAQPQLAASLFAKRFEGVMSKPDTNPDRQAFQRLIRDEHRRWLLYQVCNGWSAPDSGSDPKRMEQFALECIERKKVNDTRHMRHICILTSTEAMPLNTWNPEDWDAIDRPIPSELDPLDSMSVALHRQFLTNAQQEISPEYCRYLLDCLSKLFERSPSKTSPFARYRQTVNEIVDGIFTPACRPAARKAVKNLSDHAEQTWNSLPPQYRLQGRNNADELNRCLFAAVEALSYRNYKKNDLLLVEHIPYILTNRLWHTMAQTFAWSNAEGAENALRAVETISPSTLLSLAVLPDGMDGKTATQQIAQMIDRLEQTGAVEEIQLLAFAPANGTEGVMAELNRELSALHGSLPFSWELLPHAALSGLPALCLERGVSLLECATPLLAQNQQTIADTAQADPLHTLEQQGIHLCRSDALSDCPALRFYPKA